MPKHKDIDWLNKKKKNSYKYCLQETHIRLRETYKLKVREWKNLFLANGDQK